MDETPGPDAEGGPPEVGPGDVRPPDLVHLASLIEATAHWLEVAQLRPGERPLRAGRFAIINATAFLCVFLGQVRRDPGWLNAPRFQKLALALDVVAGYLRKVMERGRLAWRDGRIEYDPPEHVVLPDGSIDFPVPPLYLGSGGAAAVERALLDLRGVLGRFRAEGIPSSGLRPGREPSPPPAAGPALDIEFESIQLYGPAERPVVNGSWVRKLTPGQYRDVRALVRGCTEAGKTDGLIRGVRTSDMMDLYGAGRNFASTLRRLRAKSVAWKAAIVMAEGSWAGYDIAPAASDGGPGP